MHPSSNILRSSVIGCVAKYELAKKRCHGGIFCFEIEVFRQEKGHIILLCYVISDFRQFIIRLFVKICKTPPADTAATGGYKKFKKYLICL